MADVGGGGPSAGAWVGIAGAITAGCAGVAVVIRAVVELVSGLRAKDPPCTPEQLAAKAQELLDEREREKAAARRPRARKGSPK